MQSAVLAMTDSVCLYVRLSDTRWYYVKTTKATIMRSSLETLVSSGLTSPRNSKENTGAK